MEYRNIFLANPAKIRVLREQLVIEQAETFTVPLEDISAVLIESRQALLLELPELLPLELHRYE